MVTDNTQVTELELKILQKIWENGGVMSVSRILEQWTEEATPGYTTILKTLQKMEQKGIVGHEQAGKKYTYYPTVSKESITQKRLSAIIDRMFESNRLLFAEYFVTSSHFSSEELNQLKALIEAKEQGGEK